MAEIDIKDLGDAAAIADTDQILAIINGLGKNINWARFKELLTAQLPVATLTTKGLIGALNNGEIGIYDTHDDLTPDLNLKKNFACIACVKAKNSIWYGSVHVVLVLPVSSDWVMQLAFRIDGDPAILAFRSYIGGSQWTDWRVSSLLQ